MLHPETTILHDAKTHVPTSKARNKRVKFYSSYGFTGLVVCRDVELKACSTLNPDAQITTPEEACCEGTRRRVT